MIRIGVPKHSYPPWYNNCSRNSWKPSQKCLLPGILVDIMRELTQKMNLSHEEIIIDESSEDNGNHSLAYIINQTVDTLIYVIMRSPWLNENRLDYSYPVMSLPYLFVYKFVDNSFNSYLTSLSKPFSFQVWLTFILILFLFFVSWNFVSREMTDNSRFRFISNQFAFIDFFKGQVDQEHIQKIATSKTLYFIFLYTFIIILSALYQNGLLISFREGKSSLSLSSFSELVSLLENNVVKIVTDEPDFTFFKRVSFSDGGVFAKINRSFAKHNFLKVNSKEEIIEQLMTGRYIYPTVSFDDILIKSHESCHLTQVYGNDIKEWFSFVFRKNSSILPVFNAAITNSWSMINYHLEKYQLVSPKVNETCREKRSTTSASALNLHNLLSSYIILVVGLFVALIIFLVEVHSKYR